MGRVMSGFSDYDRWKLRSDRDENPDLEPPPEESHEPEESMTKEQYDLLVELALAVHKMAPPDSQRRISRAMERVMSEAQRDVAPTLPLAATTHGDER